MNWIFFAIVPRALWSINNVIDKTLVEKHIPNPYVFAFFEGIVGLILLLPLLIFYKFTVPSATLLLVCLGAGILYIYALIPYYHALSFEEASRIVPLWQMTPILVLVISALSLGERISQLDLLAFVLLVGGGILISLKKIDGKLKIGKVFWVLLTSVVLFAIGSVLTKFIYQKVSYFDAFVLIRVGSLLGVLPLLISTNVKNQIVKIYQSATVPVKGLFTANESINLVAIASIEFAYVSGPASLISALQASQPLFLLVLSVVLSVWFPKILKEEVSHKTVLIKLASVFLIGYGIYLLASQHRF